MPCSARSDRNGVQTLYASQKKCPKSNGRVPGGFRSKALQLLLSFLKQMFHTNGLSRRPVGGPRCSIWRTLMTARLPSFTCKSHQSVGKVEGMRVEAVTLRKLQMRLKEPFETSFGVTHNRTLLLVEMQSEGVTGWSEITAMEAPVFNTETVATAAVILKEALFPAILGKDFATAAV